MCSLFIGLSSRFGQNSTVRIKKKTKMVFGVGNLDRKLLKFFSESIAQRFNNPHFQ